MRMIKDLFVVCCFAVAVLLTGCELTTSDGTGATSTTTTTTDTSSSWGSYDSGWGSDGSSWGSWY